MEQRKVIYINFLRIFFIFALFSANHSTFKHQHLVKIHIAATLRGLILAIDGPWQVVDLILLYL